MKTDDLRNAALSLPDAERAALARELIDSLDGASEVEDVSGWASAWGAEIAARMKQFDDDGQAASHDDVMREARARLDALRA